MGKLINLVGQTYNRLTVISFQYKKDYVPYWLCQCICGKKVIVNQSSLKRQLSKSCGCLRDEASRSRTKHNEASKNRTREYSTWAAIIQRCCNTKNKAYPDYGGRGIKICDRWRNSYQNFLSDMGRSPSPDLSIDRKNNDGDYEPDNCRWATQKEQTNNHRRNRIITYNGNSKTLAQWAESINIGYHTLERRLAASWSIEDALTKSIRFKSKQKKRLA